MEIADLLIIFALCLIHCCENIKVKKTISKLKKLKRNSNHNTNQEPVIRFSSIVN